MTTRRRDERGPAEGAGHVDDATARQSEGASAVQPGPDSLLPADGPEAAQPDVQVAERAAAATNHPVDVDPASFVGSAQPTAMAAVDDSAAVAGSGSPALGTPKGRIRLGDRFLLWLATGAGVFTVALIGLIALFLLVKAVPAIVDDKQNFFFTRSWNVDGANLHFGIVDLLWTTVMIAVLAMAIALPISVGIALFITQYAPKRLAKPVGYIVDLLAAIPSIIYGVWGIIVLAPYLKPVQSVLYHLHFIPLFANKQVQTGTVFNAGVVLAIMILPIITAVSRDVFERTPRANIEAAWALGATRWEMIRLTVLPYGRPGIVSGAMLGLGRALGETIAVTLILSTRGDGGAFSWSIFDGGATFASKIANAAAEFNDPRQTGAYIAGGLVLFVLTFAVNAAARVVINRRREFS